jgi:hypothetical protein
MQLLKSQDKLGMTAEGTPIDIHIYNFILHYKEYNIKFSEERAINLIEDIQRKEKMLYVHSLTRST